ncbi:NAD(+)/NADH kinase [bacterium]|nr:NAD(+)/NADH kinase [bacterium]
MTDSKIVPLPRVIKREDVKTVVVTSSAHKPAGQDVARALGVWFERAGIAVRSDVDGSQDLAEIGKGADLCVSVGGDGTILATARRMQSAPIPTLGINIGKLGFLAEFAEAEIRDWIAGRRKIELRILPRMMLKCIVRHHGHEHVKYALNDAVVHQGVLTRLVMIDMYVDDEHATQYRADGVIVSTPVGSTAYSLSLGGPILTPGLKAFIVTPIAPHALTNRPIVVDGSHKLHFKVLTPVDEAALVLDGHEKISLERDAEFVCTRAERDFPLVCHMTRSYYSVLKQKLHWGTAPVLGEEGEA